MDPMVGRFLLYLGGILAAILAAIGINKALFGTARWIKAQLWPTEQAKADLHESFKAKR